MDKIEQDTALPPSRAPSPPTIRKRECAVLYPGSDKWIPLDEFTHRRLYQIRAEDFGDDDWAKLEANKLAFSSSLQKALQLPNLGFFAGSGTSLGKVSGPSMWELWVKSMFEGEAYDETKPNHEQLTEEARQICEKVRYNEFETPNIEHFLSACDAYQLVYEDPGVSDFLRKVKSNVLEQCSTFLDSPKSDISSYEELLRKLAKRRVRDPRLKVFTTNYDTCFEKASSSLGMMLIDGFSYTNKRRFDGKYFNYDVVNRSQDDQTFIQGVIQLYKLHGSVSWVRQGNEIFEAPKADPESACLIYPAKGKYQQAFIQPHLELLSRFLDFLRQPNSCLLISGFGFNDDHLSEPILSAVQSNPGLKLIVSDLEACSNSHAAQGYWKKLSDLAARGADITFVNGSFDNLVSFIPNLAALSPAEKLAESVTALTSVGGNL